MPCPLFIHSRVLKFIFPSRCLLADTSFAMTSRRSQALELHLSVSLLEGMLSQLAGKLGFWTDLGIISLVSCGQVPSSSLEASLSPFLLLNLISFALVHAGDL